MSRLCEALRFPPGHRGRGVDSGGERCRVVSVKLTFEKMAAVRYGASVSIPQIPPCLSVGRATRRSGCGMWERARSSRSSRATGDCILRKVASLPRERLKTLEAIFQENCVSFVFQLNTQHTHHAPYASGVLVGLICSYTLGLFTPARATNR